MKIETFSEQQHCLLVSPTLMDVVTDSTIFKILQSLSLQCTGSPYNSKIRGDITECDGVLFALSKNRCIEADALVLC